MTVLSRLHFSPQSRAHAESIIAEHAAELEAVRADAVPEVTVATCCGLRRVKLYPAWASPKRVAAAVPNVHMVYDLAQKRGRFALLIEIVAD